MTTAELFDAIDEAVALVGQLKDTYDRTQRETIAATAQARAEFERIAQEQREVLASAKLDYDAAVTNARALQAQFQQRTSSLLADADRVRQS